MNCAPLFSQNLLLMGARAAGGAVLATAQFGSGGPPDACAAALIEALASVAPGGDFSGTRTA
jgi:hypothetical protein